MCGNFVKASQLLALAASLLVCNQASAAVWVGGGIEYFTWGEYYDYSLGTDGASSAHELLQEAGFRPFVEANAEIPVSERISLAVAGRAYSGHLDYDGRMQTFSGGTVTFSPYKSSSEYQGARAEVGILYTPLPRGEYEKIGFVAMAGYETFTRAIKGSLGYTEEYQVSLLRLGAQLEASRAGGWTGRGGVIYPLHTEERVRVMDGVTVTPKGAAGFYFAMGRRFGRFLEAGFTYEKYRFDMSDRSPEVTLNGVGQGFSVRQPRTETDTYQMYLKVGI